MSDIILYRLLGYVAIILFLAWPYRDRIYTLIAKWHVRRQLKRLADSSAELTPRQFFRLRNRSFGGSGRPKYALSHNFAGVYILHNKTKNMVYVGQATKILNRVNNHFTGKGNGDVYADYKYGDQFTIRMIALENSGYRTLNELERNLICAYDAYTCGYNKNRGNV